MANNRRKKRNHRNDAQKLSIQLCQSGALMGVEDEVLLARGNYTRYLLSEVELRWPLRYSNNLAWLSKFTKELQLEYPDRHYVIERLDAAHTTEYCEVVADYPVIYHNTGVF